MDNQVLCLKKQVSIFIVGICLLFAASANAFQFKGNVVDSQGVAISGAYVQFFEPARGIVVYGITCTAEGTFSFADFMESSYQIRVSAAGYPDQWYSSYANTVERQYVTRIGVAQIDTLTIKMVGSPINNSYTCKLTVNVADSAGNRILIANSVLVRLFRKADYWIVNEGYASTVGSVVFDSLQTAEYAIEMCGNNMPCQYYHPTRSSSVASYYLTLPPETAMSQDVRLFDPPMGDGQINGYCRTETDAAVAGATIQLCQLSDTFRAVYSTVTGADGSFIFENVYMNNYQLRILTADYPVQWFSRSRMATTRYPDDPLSPAHLADTGYTIRLVASPLDNPATGSVSIMVWDTGAVSAAPRGNVYLISTVNSSVLTPGYDSIANRYMLQNIPQGSYYLKLDIPGYPVQYYALSGNSSAPLYPLVISTNYSPLYEVHMTMKPQVSTENSAWGFLAGSVHDSAGPLGNATITVYNVNWGYVASNGTTNDGLFPMMSGIPQEVFIEVKHPAYPDMYWAAQGLTNDRNAAGRFFCPQYDTAYVTLQLKKSSYQGNPQTVPLCSVQVKVSDATCVSPVKGARVVLFDFDFGQASTMRNVWSPWTGYSDSTGRVTIPAVPFGKYRCFAEAESLNYVTQFFPKTDMLSGAKVIVIDSTMSTFTADFCLREGAVFGGKVVETSGTPIAGAHIYLNNTANTGSLEGVTGEDGSWKISGLSKGVWHAWVTHEKYLMVQDTLKREYTATEGATMQLQNFVMKPGGYVAGSFSSQVSIYDTASGSGLLRGGDLSIFPVAPLKSGSVQWPAYTTGLQFHAVSEDGLYGTFTSYVTLPGNCELVFTPRAVSEVVNVNSTASVVPSFGYSFITVKSSGSSQMVVPAGDTAKDGALALRKGFSIFGTVQNASGTVVGGNYTVVAFVKRDSLLYRVTQARQLINGRFELPGLIDNEEYFIQYSADGYPPQFLGDSISTVTPLKPFKFTAATYVPLALVLSANPAGTKIDQMQGPVSLTIENDSAGYPLLSWQMPGSMTFTNFMLYRIDRANQPKLLADFTGATSDGRYSYRDLLPLNGMGSYIVTGKSSQAIVRSNRVEFDPRRSENVQGLWLDVYSNRWGIMLEWGSGKNTTFSEKDSVNVYRQKGGEVAKLLYRRSGWNTMIDDHSWDRRDSGMVYRYYVEVPTKSLKSSEKLLSLDNAFFAGLTKVHKVGPYEQYQRISDAIAKAADFEHIEVRSGVYRENLNFAGKCISINGSWDYGQPPVLEGGGATAVTIPFCKNAVGYERPRISGFAIKNSSVGVLAQHDVEVEACLFDNVTVAVNVVPDSLQMVQKMLANPFRQNTIDVQMRHCTAIATRSGSIVASITAFGKAEQPGYTGSLLSDGQFYISPCYSISSALSIEGSDLAFYESRGQQSKLPVTVRGNSSRVFIGRSNLWRTSPAPGFAQCYVEPTVTQVDPQFTDTIWWMLSPSSPLAKSTYENYWGYDVRKLNGGSNQNNPEPSAIKNLTIQQVGLTEILLSWSAPGAAENVVRYHIYRIPGKPELFYVNQESKWDLRIPEDSIFKVVDSFSTDKNVFLDTTVRLGEPCMYVVAAVDRDGNEGKVDIVAPPDITTYFVNKPVEKRAYAGNRWHMIGNVGGFAADVTAGTPHAAFGWNDKNPVDKLYAQYYRTSLLAVGGGYWCKFAKDTTLGVSPGSLEQLKQNESEISVSLQKGNTGWNLISSPFPFVVKPDWISAFDVWEWNADSSGYRKASAMKPWNAYWIYTDRDTTLALWKKRTAAEYQSMPLAKTARVNAVWQLRLSLYNGTSWDTDNFIGCTAGNNSMSTRKPPVPMDGTNLYIIPEASSGADEGSRNASRLAALYKTEAGRNDRFEWNVGIAASETAQELTVSELSALPDNLHAFWVEKNRIVNLRENNTIAFAASKDDHHGIVVVTAHPEDIALYTGKLQVQTPFPNPSRSSATIAYTIPYDWAAAGNGISKTAWDVRLTIYDLSGRQVATLLNGKKPAGRYTAVWQGKNQSGNKAAPGMYFIKLSCGKMQKLARLCRVE